MHIMLTILKIYIFFFALQWFSGHFANEDISSMCAVRNKIWIGTLSGVIKIFHALTLKTKFASTLESKGPGGTFVGGGTILDILYVEEMRTVLVANNSGEIWCFDDTITKEGLRLQKKIDLSYGFALYDLAKVCKIVELLKYNI